MNDWVLFPLIFHKYALYRQRADEVLESAKKVVQSLEEADAAQTKARNAIKLSNEDISLARADLEQVIDIFISYKLEQSSDTFSYRFSDRRRDWRRSE